MTATNKTTIETMKELLADSKNRIKLDDFVSENIKKFLAATDLQQFPVVGLTPNKEEFLERMKRYEDVVKELQQIVILLAKWGESEQILLLEKIFTRLGEADKGSGGYTLWINFGWYPLQILMYSAGITAIAVKKFDVLKVSLTTLVPFKNGQHALIVPVSASFFDVGEAWKWVPGHERKYTPRSEHLYESLQVSLEELLFLGASYEKLFDEFEIYLALVFSEATGREWAPIGRFGWKYRHQEENNPLDRIVTDAKNQGAKWPAAQAGLFHGSSEEFIKLVEKFRERLNELSWF